MFGIRISFGNKFSGTVEWSIKSRSEFISVMSRLSYYNGLHLPIKLIYYLAIYNIILSFNIHYIIQLINFRSDSCSGECEHTSFRYSLLVPLSMYLLYECREHSKLYQLGGRPMCFIT